MSISSRIRLFTQRRLEAKKIHKRHMKIKYRTRTWKRKAVELKKNRKKTKRDLKRLKSMVKNYHKTLDILAKHKTNIESMIQHNVQRMYMSLHNITVCSHHGSVQDLTRQAMCAYIREQPNRFNSSLAHVWNYDHTSREYNILEIKLNKKEKQIDHLKIEMYSRIRDFV